MKRFILGIIVGGIISTSLFGYSAGLLKTIQVGENSVKVKVNGKDLTSPNYVIDGRTYLGLRDIGDSFNKDIGWDGNTSTVTISDKGVTSAVPTKDIEDMKSQSVAKDPKSQFIEHVEKLFSKNKTVIPANGAKGWVKKKFEAESDYSYNIVKTDSIVSPYTAELNFKTTPYITEFHPTEDLAIQDNEYKIIPVGKYVSRFEYKYHYAYQDNIWVFKYAEEYSNLGNPWSIPKDFKEEDYFMRY